MKRADKHIDNKYLSTHSKARVYTYDDVVELMESYAKETMRAAWSEIRRDWKCEKKFDQWYNEWNEK